MSGKIVTFYSFKGGVGRSMALANIAWILAANSYKVLVIDWDLEAPGLHRYFRPFLNDKELEETPGLIDIMWDYSDLMLTPKDAWPTGLEDPRILADAQRYAVPLEFPYVESKGHLHFLGAGKQNLSYASRVREFNWSAFYERLGGGEFLDAFRERLKEQYDFVLIDSRTGLADISGICTMQMPDCVVLCFNYNRQSIKGSAVVAQSILDQRPEGGVELLPVPMRVEDGLPGLPDAKLFAREVLDGFLTMDGNGKKADEYWANIKVIYRKDYALQETLAILRESPIERDTMLSDMQWLAGRISEGTPRQLLIPALEQSLCKKYLEEFTLRTSAKPVKPYQVPLLPRHYLRRPPEFDQLEAAILNTSSRLVGVYGIAGVGKSMLVADIARHDDKMRRAFPNGIYWLIFGRQASVTAKQSELIRELGVNTLALENWQEGREKLTELTRSRACLVILDDVWDEAQVRAFTGLGQRCRLLVTTCKQKVLSNIGASEYRLDLPGLKKGLELLAHRIEQPVVDELPPEARAVAERCSYSPLALVVLGALIREGAYAWQNMLDRLRDMDVQRWRERLGEYELPDGVLAALEISVEDLPPDAKDAFLDCAVFPENAAIPEATLQTLWSERFPGDKTVYIVQFFVERSLMRRDEERRYYLHDLYHHYLRIQVDDLPALNRHLLDNYHKRCRYDWASGPDDGYFFQYLPYHLAQAGNYDELHNLLLNYNWIAAKLKATNVQAVIADYMDYKTMAGDDERVALLQQALQRFVHILSQDKTQMPSQLFDRLREMGRPDIMNLLKDSCGLRFSGPKPPPYSEPKTFLGHEAGVHAVAVTSDGRWAISGSYDRTLECWDLETGISRTTFRGHTKAVYAAAVTPDSKYVISGSADHELRIWELETGALRCILGGHEDKVYAVAILPDGRRVISGSRDHTLRLWDLNDHKCLATFDQPYSGPIYTVAVTPDGQYIISGSGDYTLKLWSLTSGRLVRTLPGHTERVLAVKVLPDGWRAISSSSDCTLRLWDLDSGTLIRSLGGHTNHIFAVAVLPDGRRAISGSGDHSLRIWDLDTGNDIILGYHSEGINAVAVLPDGRRAISGSADHTLKLWNLEAWTGLPRRSWDS